MNGILARADGLLRQLTKERQGGQMSTLVPLFNDTMCPSAN